jgi:hypothetical protein
VVEYGNIYYLQADYSVQCWSERHMPYVIVSVVCKWFVHMVIFCWLILFCGLIKTNSHSFLSFFLARHLFICIGDPFRYVCRFV